MAERRDQGDNDDTINASLTALSVSSDPSMELQAAAASTSIDELVREAGNDFSLEVQRDRKLMADIKKEEESLSSATLGKGPHEVLKICFSKQSHLTSASSFAERHQDLKTRGKDPLNVIGVGTFGVVFEIPGTLLVVKKIKDCDRRGASLKPLSDQLVKDHNIGRRLAMTTVTSSEYLRIKGLFPNIEIPRVPYYRPETWCTNENTKPEKDSWWMKNGHKFEGTQLRAQDLAGPLFLFERILPLTKLLRESLIKHYFPEDQQEAALKDPSNQSCLIRPYLGCRFEDLTAEQKREPPSNGDPGQEGWSLRNFPLYLDQLSDFEQFDPRLLAQQMALAVANAHYRSNVDLMDVEFVLGSRSKGDYHHLRPARAVEKELVEQELIEQALKIPRVNVAGDKELAAEHDALRVHFPDFKHRAVQLWMVDFDKANFIPSMTEKTIKQDVESLVDRTCANDPYYPSCTPSRKEDWDLWLLFRSTYITASKILIARDHARKVGHMRDSPQMMDIKKEELRVPHEVMNAWLSRSLKQMSKGENKAWRKRFKEEGWTAIQG